MVYRIAGGIFITLLGLQMLGYTILDAKLLGIVGVVAGIALLAGK